MRAVDGGVSRDILGTGQVGMHQLFSIPGAYFHALPSPRLSRVPLSSGRRRRVIRIASPMQPTLRIKGFKGTPTSSELCEKLIFRERDYCYFNRSGVEDGADVGDETSCTWDLYFCFSFPHPLVTKAYAMRVYTCWTHGIPRLQRCYMDGKKYFPEVWKITLRN